MNNYNNKYGPRKKSNKILKWKTAKPKDTSFSAVGKLRNKKGLCGFEKCNNELDRKNPKLGLYNIEICVECSKELKLNLYDMNEYMDEEVK